jgi:hypothetical protein
MHLGHDNVSAQACQFKGGSASDAAPGTGDEGDLSFQFHTCSP